MIHLNGFQLELHDTIHSVKNAYVCVDRSRGLTNYFAYLAAMYTNMHFAFIMPNHMLKMELLRRITDMNSRPITNVYISNSLSMDRLRGIGNRQYIIIEQCAPTLPDDVLRQLVYLSNNTKTKLIIISAKYFENPLPDHFESFDIRALK